jgi:alpha-D-ribose 1-methylphosphonate 5-triphosphate synthase subunit PhnH
LLLPINFEIPNKLKLQNGELLIYNNKTNKYEANSTSTITLTDRDYEALLAASSGGLSAKTTKGNIRFHTGYNVMERLKNNT